ncbi:MAG: class I SAM-dependent methyltransferase [Verrucomicrobia bacterium]|nr:class I SAM-dependent methyltransferase [Verrucomicrobiota bacterium]
MQLSRKLQKLWTGEFLTSATNAYYRWRRPLDATALVQKIDLAGLERIRAKYEVPGERVAWPKYVNADHWLRKAIGQVRELHLDRTTGKQILDLGSGAGYFLFTCKQLGHDGIGLDLPEPAYFGEMFSLLGLERVVWRINAYQPLPELGRKFDLVTAFAICFNGHNTDQVWGPSEWDFFLRDLETRVLSPGGEVFLALNPEPYGHFTPDLKRFFSERGATTERGKIRLKLPAAKRRP